MIDISKLLSVDIVMEERNLTIGRDYVVTENHYKSGNDYFIANAVSFLCGCGDHFHSLSQ